MVCIDQEKCVGCGNCISDCVANNIEIVDEKARVKGACLQCGHCVSLCPCDAVSIPEYDMADVEPIAECYKMDPEVFLGCVKARRSIRDFAEKKVPQENLLLLAEAGRYSATANNGQFHRYIFVQDELPRLKEMVWNFVDELLANDPPQVPEYSAYQAFQKRRLENPADDFLFRNAPAVLFITSQRMLDAGMAAQNMEMMATTLGMGALFNGFLVRLADINIELKKWLGIEQETICACMLLGDPKRQYKKTAPRKKAEVSIF